MTVVQSKAPVVDTKGHICFVLRSLFKHEKIKIMKSEVFPDVFIRDENKGLFHDGISGKLTIFFGLLQVLCYNYCSRQVFVNRFNVTPTYKIKCEHSFKHN